MRTYVNPVGPGRLHDHWCPAGGRLIPCTLDPCPFPFTWSCGTCPTEEPAIAAELARRGMTPGAWYLEQRLRSQRRSPAALPVMRPDKALGEEL
jgi:hypothetical protein